MILMSLKDESSVYIIDYQSIMITMYIKHKGSLYYSVFLMSHVGWVRGITIYT